jgi:16S rRNA (uracil1498-N3)-methyltransferase
MRLNRFFTSSDISGTRIVVKEKNLIHQILRVLRLKKEDEIVVCDGKGNEAHVRITRIGKDTIEGDVLFFQKNIAEPSAYVALYCGIVKKENFEWIAQKAVEVGVSEIIPLRTKRTVKTALHPERIKKIMQEAAEQCGRARISVLHPPVDFIHAIESAYKENKKNIAYHAGGQDARDFFKENHSKESVHVGVWIGPEGGWDASELQAFQEKRFAILSLGSRTLRAETAAIVGIFLVAA